MTDALVTEFGLALRAAREAREELERLRQERDAAEAALIEARSRAAAFRSRALEAIETAYTRGRYDALSCVPPEQRPDLSNLLEEP